MSVHRRPAFVLRALALASVALTMACGDDTSGANGTVALPPGFGQPPAEDVAPPPRVPFSPETRRYGVRVLASHPHDPQAFTQGLDVYEGTLFESTGQEGRSSVRHVDLRTGRVLRRADLPYPLFGEGIAVLDGRVYQLTWKSQRGFVYDAATLAPVDSFTYTGEGWGLATDGTKLYMSDGTATVRVVDPAGFRTERTFQVTEAGRPVYYLNELEWVDGELWANIWMTDWVARIDPATGQVTGWIDLSGLLTSAERTGPTGQALVDVTNGIAYDAATRRLLVTGKLWPRIFEVEVVGK
ncbi:MAG TPA: glutaminyl-peptide cyclotransferase [Gemmatimonadaceae bacterium]|nr:glutaminyl-peptide cyclotransferase [Gemmatimonadaceae bacterium]